MLRRKKLGEAFIDISKYAVTVGVIGGFISNKVSIEVVFGLSAVAILSAVAGWFILPIREDSEE